MTRTPARLAALLAATAVSTAVAAVAIPTTAATAAPAAAAPDRPGTVRGGNTWQLRDSLTGGAATRTFSYGSTGDWRHVTGDWDGNGTRTPGIVRVVGGNYVWYLRNANSAGATDVTPFAYGRPSPIAGVEASDFPIVGDWDGDGKDGPGVVRVRYGAAAPRWLLRDSTTTGAAQHDFAYGGAYDSGFVTGDWDGNGTDTPGLVRFAQQQRPTWLLRDVNASGGAQRQFQYGSSFEAEAPVVGDWNGDGTDGIGMLRYENRRNRWLLRETPTAGSAQHSFLYGAWADRPVLWS